MIKTPAHSTGRSVVAETPNRGSLLFRSWQWVKSQVVGEVPKESELCEFDCRKQQCALGEWATCERRLHQAAGELMPYSSGRASQDVK